VLSGGLGSELWCLGRLGSLTGREQGAPYGRVSNETYNMAAESFNGEVVTGKITYRRATAVAKDFMVRSSSKCLEYPRTSG
jgi:hypothetical protein